MRLAARLFPMALLAGTSATAQPADQVGGQSPAVDVGTPPPTRSTEAPPQISANSDSTAAEMQLTSARASHQPTAQLSNGGPNADAPEGLSHPAEGRTAAIERVNGTDRCDPAVPREKRTEECRKVIESRADDYARPAPTELSPEQKLLIAREWGPGAAEAAANRLAKSGSAEGTADSLGIAAIVLRQAQPAKQDDQKQEDDAASTNPAVQAIIQILTQTPQN